MNAVNEKKDFVFEHRINDRDFGVLETVIQAPNDSNVTLTLK